MIESRDKNCVEILSIPFTVLKKREIIALLKQSCSGKISHQLFLATPNPEIVLNSLDNARLRNVLQKETLNLPDGHGIIWARYFLKQSAKIRFAPLAWLWGAVSLPLFLFLPKNEKHIFGSTIHGSDLTRDICLDAELGRQGVFFLGNSAGLAANSAELAAKRLQKLNPQLLVSGHRDSTPSDQSVINTINHSGAKILLVAFGAPAQEIWLDENLKKLPQIRIAMGVGGTFDFIAGIVPRAPQWMRKIGLEWVYRLYRQPRKRLKRIFNAFCVFPWTVIKKRQQHHSPSGKSS